MDTVIMAVKKLEDVMLEFVGKAFRSWMNIILWITLVCCAIGGGVAGYFIKGIGFCILGIIVGAIIGLIENIMFGGFISNFLNMVASTEKMVENTEKIINTHS